MRSGARCRESERCATVLAEPITRRIDRTAGGTRCRHRLAASTTEAFAGEVEVPARGTGGMWRLHGIAIVPCSLTGRMRYR